MICICLHCKKSFEDLKNEMVNRYLDNAPCPSPECTGTVILAEDKLVPEVMNTEFDNINEFKYWHKYALRRAHNDDIGGEHSYET